MMARRKASLPPGFDDKREPVSAEVDNVYGLKDRRGFTIKEPVIKNVRESSLTAMHARGQLDDAQLRAGEWFRSKYEKMRMGSMAIDPSYEPVDISGHADPIPDRVIMAGQALSKARTHLGVMGWTLVELVCGQGFSIAAAANRRYGLASKAQLAFTGQLLRAALDELAIYLGYASASRGTQNLVDNPRG